ncbi:glycosyltransferase family 4 protein [Peribacillus simplex]|uniref:glycosyltransferase family 4 protein n=1 Tax=Peribacillus simplex TaxID=1478 RepID=UPI003D2CDED4
MKKVLFTATVDSHILNFHLPYLKWFKEQGYEVHVASNGTSDIPYVDVKHKISFDRSPLSLSNFKALKQLRRIVNINNYKLIHCHTPMGSVLTRLAAKNKRKMGTKVVYTAHGFHFYKGAPLKNWALYYPIEKWLSKYTDCLITINEEDYLRVKNNFQAKSIKLVNGVGIDLNKYIPQAIELKSKLRGEYNFNENDFIIMYAAELNHNKHQDLLINAISVLKKEIPNIRLLLAGEGELLADYKELVNKLKLKDHIYFLGFRKDIEKLLALSDLAVSSSRREGLPLNIMEAMATGLPLVVTDCRGNRDLVSDNNNGFVIRKDDVKSFASAIEKIYKTPHMGQKFANKSLGLVSKYSLESVCKKMEDIYLGILK